VYSFIYLYIIIIFDQGPSEISRLSTTSLPDPGRDLLQRSRTQPDPEGIGRICHSNPLAGFGAKISFARPLDVEVAEDLEDPEKR
jgi:hypothetical protein